MFYWHTSNKCYRFNFSCFIMQASAKIIIKHNKGISAKLKEQTNKQKNPAELNNFAL